MSLLHGGTVTKLYHRRWYTSKGSGSGYKVWDGFHFYGEYFKWVFGIDTGQWRHSNYEATAASAVEWDKVTLAGVGYRIKDN